MENTRQYIAAQRAGKNLIPHFISDTAQHTFTPEEVVMVQVLEDTVVASSVTNAEGNGLPANLPAGFSTWIQITSITLTSGVICVLKEDRLKK